MWGRRIRKVIIVLILGFTIHYLVTSIRKDDDNKGFLPVDMQDNLSLTEAQCTVAFPGLTKEIDEAVARGPFLVKQSNFRGPLQGRIKDGKLYIVNWQRKGDLSRQMLDERTAALNQLYRAIITSPEPLPDTIFSLNILDQPMPNSWSYARPADRTTVEAGHFLMPHFSFWAWPLPFIGSLDRALSAISAIEAALPFQSKISRAVWRGTAWFNDVRNGDLRKRLLQVAQDKPWADVEELKWGTNAESASNALAIEDFCRYKYIIYTEGITYSGRLPFHQACRSVILAPPISWMLHSTHLVKPVFSSTLLRRDPLSDRNRHGWSTDYGADDANVVFVSPDWSDLEATIEWLEEHPRVAEGIARRQRDLFVDGGYSSLAAETCYWRALIKGWSEVVQWEPELEEKEGIRWEIFSLGNP